MPPSTRPSVRARNIAASALSERSAWRRLIVCLATLVLIDQAVPPALRIAEQHRYQAEGGRFERSDLFPLGPLVEYVREHPTEARPRAIFLGNSIVWGYGVREPQTIPSVFQSLSPDVHVFNVAINGFRNGDAYLITKALLDGGDLFYFFHMDEGEQAHEILPRLIEVDQEDAARFHVAPSTKLRSRWDRVADVWRLHRDAYRLQAAWFGTSTRQALYRTISRMLGRSSTSLEPAASATESVATSTGADSRLLRDYATLIRSRGKTAVVVEIDGVRGPVMSEADRETFNRTFAPDVIAIRLSAPPEWRMADGRHLTAEGCARIAQALAAARNGEFPSP